MKLTVEECELGLGARLRSADRFTADLDNTIAAGKDLLDRLSQIVAAGGGSLAGASAKGAAEVVAQQKSASPPPRKDAQAVAVAAAAFAERLRMKVHGLAA